MSISGKLFQLNIGSHISFQLRADFASVHHNRTQLRNQLDPRQMEEFEESNRRVSKANKSEKDRFYEIVGPYTDDPSALGQRPDSSMLALPERTGEKAALSLTKALSGDRRVARINHWSGRTQQSLSDGQIEYIHSYNRQGQTVFADLRTSAVDFVI